MSRGATYTHGAYARPRVPVSAVLEKHEKTWQPEAPFRRVESTRTWTPVPVETPRRRPSLLAGMEQQVERRLQEAVTLARPPSLPLTGRLPDGSFRSESIADLLAPMRRSGGDMSLTIATTVAVFEMVASAGDEGITVAAIADLLILQRCTVVNALNRLLRWGMTKRKEQTRGSAWVLLSRVGVAKRRWQPRRTKD